MADLTVSADIDTFLGAANFAAARTALGAAGLGANTFTGVQTLPAGTTAAPSINFGDATTGFYKVGTNAIGHVAGGAAVMAVFSTMMRMSNNVDFGWASGSTTGTATDTNLARLGAANLRLGLAPSATPIAQTLTIGEASRPGTDSNVAGANGTIQSGLGTGTGAASQLIFQTPTTVGAGSTVQTYATRMALSATGAAVTGTLTSSGAMTSSASVQATTSLQIVSLLRLSAPSDGVALLQNIGATDFTRLQFGGTTSAFPAIKRNAAGIEFITADDSAYAGIRTLTVQTAAPAGGTTAIWRLGTVATVTPTSPNRTIEVEIGGTTYYLAAKTTNN